MELAIGKLPHPGMMPVHSPLYDSMGGVPNRGHSLGAPRMRIILFWGGIFKGTPWFFGNTPMTTAPLPPRASPPPPLAALRARAAGAPMAPRKAARRQFSRIGITRASENPPNLGGLGCRCGWLAGVAARIRTLEQVDTTALNPDIVNKAASGLLKSRKSQSTCRYTGTLQLSRCRRLHQGAGFQT